MKKITCIILILLIQNAIAQISNLEKINLNNWAYIYLPNSMEVQSGIYKKTVDNAKKEFSINSERIVFQQKGLNDGNSKETYARVIIRTDTSEMIFPNLNTEKISATDLENLSKSFKEQTYQASNNPTFPAKIISWNPVKLVTISGQKCINYSYSRKMGDNPETYSEFFIIWKGKRQHSINIEYRLQEMSKWKTELLTCVKSLRFK